MKPTKFCNAISCSDCDGFAECQEYEVESNDLKGKYSKIKNRSDEDERTKKDI